MCERGEVREDRQGRRYYVVGPGAHHEINGVVTSCKLVPVVQVEGDGAGKLYNIPDDKVDDWCVISSPPQLFRSDFVRNDRIRQMWRESGISMNELARRLDLIQKRGKPDNTRIGRLLGTRPRGDGTWQKYIKIDTAEKIAHALGYSHTEIYEEAA